MEKIMFNDRYGLTQAVIDGRKTETRRIEPICSIMERFSDRDGIRIEFAGNGLIKFHDDMSGSTVNGQFHYKKGEIVAVAQNYRDVCAVGLQPHASILRLFEGQRLAGWTNKMFVLANLMPYKIWITEIRAERLQNITDESCLREGIRYIQEIDRYYFERTDRDERFYFNTPCEAFAALIDKVSGRGTWDRNPYVVVYEFELLK